MDYLDRFGFASETVLAMYAVTDGMPGLDRLALVARVRPQLAGAQHVPAARGRRDLDGRPRRDGHGDPAGWPSSR